MQVIHVARKVILYNAEVALVLSGDAKLRVAINFSMSLNCFSNSARFRATEPFHDFKMAQCNHVCSAVESTCSVHSLEASRNISEVCYFDFLLYTHTRARAYTHIPACRS